MRPRAAGGPAPVSRAAGGGALAAHTPPHLGARRPGQVSPGRLRAPSEGGRELRGPLQEARRGHSRPGTSGRDPSRRALGPGQQERRLLLSPGSRAAGPGEAEAPSRPAGGARRLCQHPASSSAVACTPNAAARMPRPSTAARGAAAERRRGGTPAPSPSAIGWPGGTGAARDWRTVA